MMKNEYSADYANGDTAIKHMIRGFSFKYVEGEGFGIFADRDVADEMQIFCDKNLCTSIDTGYMHNNSPSKDKGPTRLNKY